MESLAERHNSKRVVPFSMILMTKLGKYITMKNDETKMFLIVYKRKRRERKMKKNVSKIASIGVSYYEFNRL